MLRVCMPSQNQWVMRTYTDSCPESPPIALRPSSPKEQQGAQAAD